MAVRLTRLVILMVLLQVEEGIQQPIVMDGVTDIRLHTMVVVVAAQGR
jgi:hypothetical protein